MTPSPLLYAVSTKAIIVQCIWVKSNTYRTHMTVGIYSKHLKKAENVCLASVVATKLES